MKDQNTEITLVGMYILSIQLKTPKLPLPAESVTCYTVNLTGMLLSVHIIEKMSYLVTNVFNKICILYNCCRQMCNSLHFL